MKGLIFIHKVAGSKKDAVRVNSAADIPAFLQNTVKVDGESLVLDCVEGQETAPLGSVIGYEESTKTASGWNAWHIANAATNLVEKDGVFYKKATIMKAQAVGKELPAFLAGADVTRDGDTWTIATDWGESSGKIGEAYWVRYGTKPDGRPDANILTKSEKSYQEYIVCTQDGEDIGWLSELDPA